MILFFINLAVILGMARLLRESATARIPRPDHNRYLVVVMGYLMMLALLRSYDVGTDTSTYGSVFKILGKNVWKYLTASEWEKGFVLLCHVLYELFGDARSLLVVAGAFSFYSVYRFFDRYSQVPWFSVFLFFTLMIFDFFLSGLRQARALTTGSSRERKDLLTAAGYNITVEATCLANHYESLT